MRNVIAYLVLEVSCGDWFDVLELLVAGLRERRGPNQQRPGVVDLGHLGIGNLHHGTIPPLTL